MNSRKSRKRRGFTLIELIIVVAIIGIIAMAIIPNVNGVIASNQTETFEQNCRVLANAIEMYKNDHSGKLPEDSSEFDAYIAGGLNALWDDPAGATYQKIAGERKFYCKFTDVTGKEHEKILTA